MTKPRALNLALNAALAIGIAAILSTGHHLDDHGDDWAASTALQDAQRQAQADARRDRAAQQLCIRLHGPGVAPAWDQDGNLICRARKGPARTVVAKGGVL